MHDPASQEPAPHPREDDVCLDECPEERPFCGQNEGLRASVIYRCDPVTGLEIVENCEAQCDQGPSEPPVGRRPRHKPRDLHGPVENPGGALIHLSRAR